MGVFGGKNSVGVYLDTDSLSVLNAQEIGANVKILGFSSTAGLASVEKIKRIFQEAAVHAKSVSLAVPAEGSMIRYFELPALPKKEEKNAVRFEAQKYVPFDMKDLYYDYDRYPDASGKKTKIVLFACKKQWVDEISSMILLTGVKVERVELVSQAIVRAFCHGLSKKSGQMEAMIFPNDDPRSAELILFKDGSVLFTRRLSFSQQRDSMALDIPFFISEMRISFDYFFQNFKNEKIGKIYVVGSSSDASRQALLEAAQKDLALPAELIQFPQKIGAGQIFTTGMAASYGLVLARLSSDKSKKINLKPAEGTSGKPLTWPEEKKQLQDLAMKEILGVAAALVGLYLILSSVVSSKNSELERALSAYPKAESASIQDSLNDLEVKRIQLNEKLAFGAALLDQRSYFTLKMNELAKNIPAQVYLTKLHYDDTTNNRGGSDLVIHLEGYALSTEIGSELSVINKLVQQLSENKDFMMGFDEIKIASTKRALYKTLPATKFILDCSSLKKS